MPDSRTDTVRRVAHLARLELSDDELALFTRQFSDLLGFVDRLSEVDVEGVEPFLNASAEVAAGGEALRPDEAGETLPTDRALQNAPQSGDGFFRVPAVLDA